METIETLTLKGSHRPATFSEGAATVSAFLTVGFSVAIRCSGGVPIAEKAGGQRPPLLLTTV